MASTEFPSPIVSCQDAELYEGRDGEASVVRLRGEHDAFTADALSQILARAMALSLDGGDLVIELSQVTFMGIATVGVIIRVQESLREQSRSLTLRSPSPPARRILELCGLSLLFDPPSPESSLLANPRAEERATASAHRRGP
jgi:anti-anti-sigma factor